MILFEPNLEGIPVGARLLTREQAKQFCGVAPERVAAPYRFGRRLLWDRKLLTLRIEGGALLPQPEPPPAVVIEPPELKPEDPRTLHRRMKVAVHKSLRGQTGGSSWYAIVGYSVQDLRAHLESRFADGMCWENIGAWHIDHRRPLASFRIAGRDCPDFKAAWALSNLQPLWARDNLRKGARWSP